MLVNQLEESLSYICFYVLAVRGIVPYSDVAKMIENIKFRNYSDKFINMVEEDKKRIRTSQSVFIPADKTRNMYEMSAPAYNKLVTENVTDLQTGRHKHRKKHQHRTEGHRLPSKHSKPH